MVTWSARQIWKSMNKQQRLDAALALFSDERLNRTERFQSLAPWIAGQGLRIQFLESLPKARRASLLATTAVPEETAAQLVLSHHLVNKRPLLGRFLDLLGIKHNDGLVDQEADLKPDREKLPGAVQTIRQEFPAEDVDLYLRALLSADPEGWKGLEELVSPPE